MHSPVIVLDDVLSFVLSRLTGGLTSPNKMIYFLKGVGDSILNRLDDS